MKDKTYAIPGSWCGLPIGTCRNVAGGTSLEDVTVYVEMWTGKEWVRDFYSCHTGDIFYRTSKDEPWKKLGLKLEELP